MSKIEIDLVVNRYSIQLGSSISKQDLKNSRFKKLHFLSRLIMKSQKGEVIYFVKKCSIECFDSEFMMVPILESSMGWHGTAAYLHFLNDQLALVRLVCFGDVGWAWYRTKEFRDICRKNLAPPKVDSDSLAVWEDSDSLLVSTLRKNSSWAFIRWVKKESPYRITLLYCSRLKIPEIY